MFKHAQNDDLFSSDSSKDSPRFSQLVAPGQRNSEYSRSWLIKRGFTLIEVMIAVAIFAVISAIIFPIVVKTIDTNTVLDRKAKEIASLQRLFVYMENDFRYMVQRTIRDPIDGLSFDPSFSVETVDDELIKFFTLSPDANTGESRTRLVAWVLDGDKLQRKTWFSISPYTDEEPRFATVVEGIESIELQLAEKTDDAINWRPDWDNAESLPSALEINVQFADGVNYRRLFEIAETIDLDQAEGSGGDSGDAQTGTGETGGGVRVMITRLIFHRIRGGNYVYFTF